ncbi:hypothetical protein GC105_03770 [Alkalibaculum sp. M08DMB]|uniref:Uncharacterized protein n=1 Tax=Alkalibaculum sporogenes TaxID=2655001 RepID=A0A6A7K636_9FIRM|nr:hypothetical protein [Alkalibaculum sporogenes]MPW24908.1 hypothetical protein [Alkalibaculum sporogenes]
MKNNLENALEDIQIIKNSIGETKNNYYNLFKILLILGIINLISFTSRIILMILGIPIFLKYVAIHNYIGMFIYILFFIYFIKIYRQEKTSSNKYYLGFLSIFAGVTFLFPLFIRILYILAIPLINEKMENFAIQLESFSQLSNILLFCLFMIICSYILKKKSMIVISAVIFFVYLVISLIYHDIGFEISHSTTTAFAYVTVLNLYYNIVTSIGYIVTAIVLKNGVNKINGVN